MTTRPLAATDQLRRIGWVLVAVGFLCAFSLVFLPSGVIAAGLGILCLIVARLIRRSPVVRADAAMVVEQQPPA